MPLVTILHDDGNKYIIERADMDAPDVPLRDRDGRSRGINVKANRIAAAYWGDLHDDAIPAVK